MTGYYTAPTGGIKVYDANGIAVTNNNNGYWTAKNDTLGVYTGISDLTVYAQWE